MSRPPSRQSRPVAPLSDRASPNARLPVRRVDLFVNPDLTYGHEPSQGPAPPAARGPTLADYRAADIDADTEADADHAAGVSVECAVCHSLFGSVGARDTHLREAHSDVL